MEFHITALATATDWRWPPDSDPTGWRIDRTVVTPRPARVSAAARSMASSSSDATTEPLASQEHVLDDVEIVGQGEVLVHGLDPQRGGVVGAADPDGLALPEDLAAVGLVDARDALDEDRLAGAVVAHERGHLTGRHDRGSTSCSACTAPKLL